ncbi:MAG: hypothetical protein ACAI44_22360, partial [Candidatus Sericytochromatia bacterium]
MSEEIESEDMNPFAAVKLSIQAFEIFGAVIIGTAFMFYTFNPFTEGVGLLALQIIGHIFLLMGLLCLAGIIKIWLGNPFLDKQKKSTEDYDFKAGVNLKTDSIAAELSIFVLVATNAFLFFSIYQMYSGKPTGMKPLDFLIFLCMFLFLNAMIILVSVVRCWFKEELCLNDASLTYKYRRLLFD